MLYALRVLINVKKRREVNVHISFFWFFGIAQLIKSCTILLGSYSMRFRCIRHFRISLSLDSDETKCRYFHLITVLGRHASHLTSRIAVLLRLLYYLHHTSSKLLPLPPPHSFPHFPHPCPLRDRTPNCSEPSTTVIDCTFSI